MTAQEIFDVIVRHAREVLPGHDGREFSSTDSLRDLGANSVDRSEIIMMTLGSLSLNIPLLEMARAQNMGELANIIHAKA